MDINNKISEAISYAESNPLIAAVTALVLIYLIIRRPKILFGLIVIVVFWGIVMQIIAKLFEVSSF